MDVVTMGAANIDLIARVARLPGVDDEVAVESLNAYGGGSAANVAVAVARLGHTSGFVGIVGNDHFGTVLLKDLENDGVDISKVIMKTGSSGMVFVAVKPDGERVMYTSKGVAGTFNSVDIPLDYIKNAKFLHLTSMVGDYALGAFEFAVKEVRKSNVKVVLDPGCIFAEKGLGALKPVLKHCFAFLPNKLEARMLTGKEGIEAAKKLRKAGPDVVVITEGLEGCTYATKYEARHIPFPRMDKGIKVADATGGGDAFAAGFLVSLLEHKSLEEAITFGMKVGYIASSREGARGAPKRGELGQFGLQI